MRRITDLLTAELFEAPLPAPTAAASMHYSREVAHQVSALLAGSGLSRYQVAARMSELAGREVSKYMLDAYSAESREAYNLPLWEVPALEVACGGHGLTTWLACKRGARLLVGRDALDAELGKLERLRDEASRKIKELKRVLEEDA